MAIILQPAFHALQVAPAKGINALIIIVNWVSRYILAPIIIHLQDGVKDGITTNGAMEVGLLPIQNRIMENVLQIVNIK